MLRKYAGWTDFQLWTEYGRLKAEWVKANGYSDSNKYDDFIKKITAELGI